MCVASYNRRGFWLIGRVAWEIMHCYTPSIERTRREWMRTVRQRRNARGAPSHVPDNSEPWIRSAPASFTEILQIADEVGKLEKKWRIRSTIS